MNVSVISRTFAGTVRMSVPFARRWSGDSRAAPGRNRPLTAALGPRLSSDRPTLAAPHRSSRLVAAPRVTAGGLGEGTVL